MIDGFTDISSAVAGYYSAPQVIYSQPTPQSAPQSDAEENDDKTKVKKEPEEEAPLKECPSPVNAYYYVRSSTCTVPTAYHCTLERCLLRVVMWECKCKVAHYLGELNTRQNDDTVSAARAELPTVNMLSTLSANPYCPQDFHLLYHTHIDGVETVGPEYINMYRSSELALSTSLDYDNNGDEGVFLQNVLFPNGPPHRACDLNEACSLEMPDCHLWPYRRSRHLLGHLQLIESRLGRIWQIQLANFEEALRVHLEQHHDRVPDRHAACKKRRNANPLGICFKPRRYKPPQVPVFKLNPNRFVRVRLHNTDDARSTYEEDFTRFCISSHDNILERKVIKFVYLTTTTPTRSCISALSREI